MSMSRVAGLEMPVEFDVTAYDQVNDRVALIANPNDPKVPLKKNSWFSYASAWNGFAIRMRSAIDYDQEFGRLIAQSTAPPPEERYFQERALFGCAASALSAVECLYMATYSVAAVLSPPNFPLLKAGHLNQSPSEVAKACRSCMASNRWFFAVSIAGRWFR